MKVLALESSAGIAGVALLEDEKILYLSEDVLGYTHSETLLPMIAECLERHGLEPKDVDLFACAAGPGSYTGIRIGVATVKGLASGSGKPCVGVSSLEALAYNCADLEGVLCPVMDARRDQMYTALFECRRGEVKRLSEDALLPLEQLDRVLKALGRQVYLIGDGAQKAEEKLTFPKKRRVSSLLQNQNAYGVARAGLLQYQREPQKDYDEGNLFPIYLRATQAERERISREHKD